MPGSNRIRVAVVAPTLAILGGHSVQAQRLIDRWRDDPEIDATLVPINPALPAPLARLSGVRYVRTALTQLVYWPTLLRALGDVDVVHVFATSNSSFFRAALPAVLIARLYGKRVIVNYKGDAGTQVQRSATVRWLLRSSDLNVVPSSYFARIFASAGLSARVIPNIVDLARFRYRVRDPIRPRIISTRNFEPLYNVECTLRAFARVQARYPDAVLTLVGTGTEESRLRLLAQALRLEHVTFAGPVPPDKMWSCYDAADIYVQTPTIDNMPSSILECFASGVPVVATNVGGVPVMLQHGVHGLLAANRDDEAVADSIAAMIERPDHARQMAAAARATCRACSWNVVRDQWLTVYRSAARSSVVYPTAG